MKLLIDTNILIPLEPTSTDNLAGNSSEAIRLAQLATATRSQLWVHPAQRVDIAQDSNESRRALREQLFSRYPELRLTVPTPPTTGTNDWVDEHLIQSLERNAVRCLITEDQRLTRKAADRVGAERVLSLQDALALLEALVDVAGRPPPAVEAVVAFDLDRSDPIWNSFRVQYPKFDDWLTRCQQEHRQAWVIRGDDGGLAGVAIVNHETRDVQGAKTLKVCSFKISDEYSGKRFGELLLKAVFKYALDNAYDSMFITAFPDHQALIALLLDFGFKELSPRPNGELTFGKQLRHGVAAEPTESPLSYHIDFGPGTMDVLGAPGLVVPIQPAFHSMLFPEVQLVQPLLPSTDAYGNSIRKAYLCRSQVRLIEHGTLLLFYRSQDERSVRVLGVAEESIRSPSADEICAFVLPRTVYKREAIEQMCQQGPVLATMFRQCLLEIDEIGYRELVLAGVLNGPPQSITRVRDEVKPWLAQRLQKLS